MWKFTQEKIGTEITKYKITQDLRVISYIEAISLLCNSFEFRTFFIELLKSSSYGAYFWEVRPITMKTTNEEFEFVMVDSPALLKIKANGSLFIKYFKQNKYAVSFLNLSGDAKLIVPIEIGHQGYYTHIAQFVRNASFEQVDAFWQRVGEEVLNSLDESMKWVSTSGLGVHWLHVRIDTKPKYYNYTPYRKLA